MKICKLFHTAPSESFFVLTSCIFSANIHVKFQRYGFLGQELISPTSLPLHACVVCYEEGKIYVEKSRKQKSLKYKARRTTGRLEQITLTLLKGNTHDLFPVCDNRNFTGYKLARKLSV